jgi:hypothetical protein
MAWATATSTNYTHYLAAQGGSPDDAYVAGGESVIASRTETFNGSAWTTGAEIIAGDDYGSASGGGTPLAGVAYAGHSSPTQREAYLFDGTTWSISAKIPSGSGGGGDGTQTDSIYCGSGMSGDSSYTFNGTAWTDAGNLSNSIFGNATTGNSSGAISWVDGNHYLFNGTSWSTAVALQFGDYCSGAGSASDAISAGQGKAGAATYIWNGTVWSNQSSDILTNTSGENTVGNSSSAMKIGGNFNFAPSLVVEIWTGVQYGTMLLAPPSLLFVSEEGKTENFIEDVKVYNIASNDSVLDNVTTDITYNSGSGWLNASRIGSTTGNDQKIRTELTAQSLTAGSYTADIDVICGNADNSPQTYSVTLYVFDTSAEWEFKAFEGITGGATLQSDAPMFDGEGGSLVGSFGDGKIYMLSTAAKTDAGVPIRRIRRTQVINKEKKNVIHNRVELDFETGVGLDVDSDQVGYDPVATIKWSDDNGGTWSAGREVKLGKNGEKNKRAILRSLGKSRNRIYELTIEEPVKFVLMGSYADLKTCKF